MSSSKKPAVASVAAAPKLEAVKEATYAPETTKAAPKQDAASKTAKLGADAVREFWESSNKELRNTQTKFLAIGREASSNLTKTTEAASRNINEVLDISRENVEALVESANLTSDVARSFAEEFYSFANQAFASGVEHSKGFLGCRTMNEVLDLQNKFFLHSVDLVFHQSVKFSDMWFRLANDAAEPLQNRAASASKRLTAAFKG